jgi:general secretion pathway protein E/type IV pilus assembly protein PilB
VIAPASATDNLQAVQQLAARFGMICVDLEQHTVDLQLLQLFPVQDLFRENVLPLSRNGNRVAVAVADPLNLTALQELTVRTGLYPDPVVAAQEQIQKLLKNALGLGGGTVQELMAMSKEEIDTLQAAAGDEIGDASQASSVVKLVNELMMEAIEQKASDIHIEPEEGDLQIRFRVDGMLQIQPMPAEIQRFRAAIVSRLKIMARMNIAEKRSYSTDCPRT